MCQKLPHISCKQHINRTLLQKKHFHFLIPPRCTGVLKIASCCMLGGMLSVHILVGRVGYSIHIQCPQLRHFICCMFPYPIVLYFSLLVFYPVISYNKYLTVYVPAHILRPASSDISLLRMLRHHSC